MEQAKNTPLSWSEDRLQQEVILKFRNKYPLLRGCLFSVPNGGRRSGFEAKLLKSTGVTAGVADLILMFNKKTYCLELKRPDGNGTQSPDQREWQLQMEAQGFDYFILNDLEMILGLLDYIVGDVKPIDFPNKQLNLF